MNQRFGKCYRLLKTDEYSSVFAYKKQKKQRYTQCFYAPSIGEYPRLGLVVGKKTAKRAHERNYMKRVIREWFRCRKDHLQPYDFVVRVIQKFDRVDRCAVIAELERIAERRL